MDGISVSAASGMKARMESLELLANNLANVETGGFKADREFYSLYTGLDATADPATGDLTTLPVIESHWTDLAQGDFRVTGNPLDFAIDGDGLFAIQTPRAASVTPETAAFGFRLPARLPPSTGTASRPKAGAGFSYSPACPWRFSRMDP
jgi:flagellar basal-body rod protein FlgF